MTSAAREVVESVMKLKLLEAMAGQQHLDRLSAIDAGFLAQEKPNTHMHIGGARAVRGRRRRSSTRSSRTSSRACTSSRATGRSSRCRRSRPAARCGSTTRPSTSPTTCATRRCRAPGDEDALLRPVRARLLPAPGPLEAAVGAVARRGARERRVRARLEDPPRGRRRRLGRRPLDACCSTSRPRARPRANGGEPWVPQPGPTSAELAARGLTGAVRAAAERRHGRARRRLAPGRRARARARGRRRHRRGRVDRAQRPARHAVQRAPRPAPPDQGRARGPRRVQARQVRVRHHRQRRRARGRDRRARLLPPVARAPHGGGRAARPPSRSRCARRSSRARSATSSPRSWRRCRSSSTTRSRACSTSRTRWTA